MKAARLAPDAIRLPADFDAYQRYSKLFKAAVRAIAPEIENRGIDEIYIDLTNVTPPPTVARDVDAGAWADRARSLAQAIKAAVRAATGLSSSIGLAPNKLLAKIASDLDKPDGLTIVTAADVASRIWPLPARKINGIGPKASVRLEGLGIRTIGELAHADPQWLAQNFGRHYGVWMHEVANGRDERPVITQSEPQSISRETTLDRDLDAVRDRAELSQIFTDLCVHVAEDLRRAGYVGRTIGLKLRFDNFRTVTRDRTIDAPTQDAQAIRRAAGECLKRVALERRIRLLGVKVAALTPVDAVAPARERPADPTLELF
jgi:DNA polymerase-4